MLKVRLSLYLKLIVFWIIYFFVARVIFLMYHSALLFKLPVSEIPQVFFHGLYMDLSVTGYLMLFYGFIFILINFFSNKLLLKVLQYFNSILISVFCLMVIADAELYRNWGFRLDTTPLLYLKTPGEAMASLKWWMIAVLLLATVIFSYLSLLFYKRFIKTASLEKKCPWYGIPVFLFLMAASIIPIRGSIGVATMQPGTVYFSKNTFANHAAVNVIWNLGYSLTKLGVENKIVYMKPEKVAETYHLLFNEKSAPIKILKNKKPDIVLVISESFSNAIVEMKYQGLEITPGFNRMKKEGIYFSRFYASGDRTERGLVAILSGYPSQTINPIINYPVKTEKLPFLSADLKKNGYSTALYYGGDINFANMKSYFINGGFDAMITKEDFQNRDLNSKWGAHDHVVFERLFSDIQHSASPFFKVFFTLSCHDPYEFPGNKYFTGNADEINYFNAARYADSSLAAFVGNCKKLPLWENLLVIVVADHGSRFPGDIPVYLPEKFHIPMLWTGGALLAADTVIETIGSQNDIAVTLLSQLEIEQQHYVFGKNLLAVSPKSFALYCYNNGIGFIRENGTMVYDNTYHKHLIFEGTEADPADMEGKALYQFMNEDYLKK